MVFSQEGCGYCEQFYPALNEFMKTPHPDLEVVMLQVNSTPEANKKFKAEHGINVPILAASNQELIDYRVKGTPTSVLIDEEGIVIGSQNILKLEDLVAFTEGA